MHPTVIRLNSSLAILACLGACSLAAVPGDDTGESTGMTTGAISQPLLQEKGDFRGSEPIHRSTAPGCA